MNLAEQLKEQALTGARQQAARDDGLAALRREGLRALEESSFPGRKSEAWKYTSLQALNDGHLLRNAPPLSMEPPAEFGGYRLVFVNGHFQAGLSTLPDETGVEIIRLDGSREPGTGDTGEFASPFAYLNGAALEDGLLVRVAEDTSLDTPLHVCFLSAGEEPVSCHTRLRLELGTGSHVNLIEHYEGRGPVLTNAVTELHAGASSHLCHYRLQSEQAETLHIGSLLLVAGRDSRVNSFQLMQGNRLRRNEIHAVLAEPGSELNMRGVFTGRGRTHTDNQVCVEHRVPHCQSTQIYKGLARDEARLVFNGRIHIHPGARQSSADLTNKNLLLSRGAEVDTKPELEIYNDDVQCSHGTTVGQLDEDALFYLRSRGVDEQIAQRMLGMGFVNELLMALPDKTIGEWARPWLGRSLSEET